MNWKKIVRNLAPTLAAGLGGPMAGTATKFLAEQFLGDKDASEKELEEAISGATPEELARLREIDNQFAVEMAQLDVDVFKLEVDDRKSARDLAKVNMLPQVILSTLFIGGYFGTLYMLFSGEIQLADNMRDLANILLGVLTANIPSIMQFWFGSSSGSKEKTARMGGKQ